MAFNSGLRLSVDSRTGEQNLRRFEGRLDRVERTGTRTSGQMRVLTTAITALAAAAGGLSFGRVIRETANFHDTLAGLRAVTSATAAQMEELESQARTLGATTQFSAQQAGQAQRFLAQAGFEVNEILDATPGVLQLATAGQMDLAEAADIASNVLGGMRMEVSELNRVNDVLAATASGANTSVQQLGQALSFAAPIAAGANVELEAVSAAIGALSDAGLQSGRAGRGIQALIRDLADLSDSALAGLEAVGLTEGDVDIEQIGLLQVLDNLQSANLSSAQTFNIFGTQAANAVNVLASGADNVRSFADELGEAEGEAERMALAIDQGLGASTRSFNSALGETILQIGDAQEGIGGGIETLIDTASGVLAVFNDMADEFAEANDLNESQVENLERMAGAISLVGDAAVVAAGIFGARMVGALGAKTAAMAAAQAQNIRYQATLASMAGVSRTAATGLGAMTVAARGATAALGLVGGPLGAAVLAAGGLYFFREELNGTAAAAREVTDAVDGFTDSINMNNEAVLRSTLGDLRDQMSGIERDMEAAQRRVEAQREAAREADRASQAGGRPTGASAGLRQAESELEDLERQAEITGGKIEVVEDRLELLGETSVQSANNVRQTSFEAMTLRQEMDLLGQSFPDFDGLADDLEDVWGRAIPARRELSRLGDDLHTIQRAQAAGFVSEDQARMIQIGLIDGMSEAAANGNQLVASFQALDEAVESVSQNAGDRFADGFERHANRIGDSLSDALMTGDWDGVGASIGAAVGSAVSDEVAKAVSQQMGAQMGAAAGPFGALVGGAAGGLMGQGLADFFSGSDAGEDGELARIRQEVQFTGTVLGSIDDKSQSIADSLSGIGRTFDQLIGINRGMLDALRGTQRDTDRFAAGLMRGFDAAGLDGPSLGDMGMAALSGTADDIFDNFMDLTMMGNLPGSGELSNLFSGITGGLFGGDVSIRDEGVRLMGGTIEELLNETAIRAYQDIRIDRGMFRSSKRRTEERRLGGVVEQQFSNVLSGVVETLEETASGLRMDSGRVSDEIEAFVIDSTRISLQSLDADAQRQEIQAFFSSTMDSIAEDLFTWTEDFQQAGEGLGETITRLATQNLVLEESHRQLGFRLNESTMSAEQFARTSESMIGFFEDTEQLARQMGQFTESFLPEAQQIANLEDQLARSLDQHSMQLPDTRDGFRELMEAQNAATEAGQRNIATILRVQGTADQYFSMLEREQSQILSAADRAFDQFMDQSPGRDHHSSRAAVASLEEMLAMGEMGSADVVSDLLSDVTAPQARDFATFEDFVRDFNRTAGVLQQVQEMAGSQDSIEEQQLSALDQQLLDSRDQHREQISALESIDEGIANAGLVHGSHASGLSSVPFDGYRAELHKGEMVVPASQAQSMRSGGTTSMIAVVAELRELQDHLRRIAQTSYQTTKNTGRTAKIIRRWEGDALPPIREEA